MISFKEYFLRESIASNIDTSQESGHSIISGVPISILGLTSRSKLPDRPPYGLWVDKSGNYIATSQHSEAAKNMLIAAYDYRDQNDTLTDKVEQEFGNMIAAGSDALYKILYLAGYMHVVKAGNTYHFKACSLSTTQERFMTDLMKKYNGPEYEDQSGKKLYSFTIKREAMYPSECSSTPR